eukprot:350742-Chlamydomonas_euryale.AAC.9
MSNSEAHSAGDVTRPLRMPSTLVTRPAPSLTNTISVPFWSVTSSNCALNAFSAAASPACRGLGRSVVGEGKGS